MPEPATPGRARIAVLISGQGRNLQGLAEACTDGRIAGEIVLVLSNRPAAAGLERARAAGLPTQVIDHTRFPDRPGFDAALAQALDSARADWVVLAGFMRVLTPAFVRRYAGRLVNIHPSLLPRHPGLDTHRRAIEAGDSEHGATVHFVTEELDGGPAIIQGRVSVGAQDDPLELAARVMQDVELRIFPQALAWLARGAVVLRDGRVFKDGLPLASPLQLDALEADFR